MHWTCSDSCTHVGPPLGPWIHHTCKLNTCKLNTGIHNFPTHWITPKALMLVTKLLSSYLSPWVWLPGEHTWRRECAGQWCTCLGSRSERKHVTTPSNSSARTDSEEKTLFFETRALNNDIIIMTKTTYSKVPQNNAKAASATATCTQIRLFTSIHYMADYYITVSWISVTHPTHGEG